MRPSKIRKTCQLHTHRRKGFVEIASHKSPKVYKNPLEAAQGCTCPFPSLDVEKRLAHNAMPAGRCISGFHRTDRPPPRDFPCAPYVHGFGASCRFPGERPKACGSVSGTMFASVSQRESHLCTRNAGWCDPAAVQLAHPQSHFPLAPLHKPPSKL